MSEKHTKGPWQYTSRNIEGVKNWASRIPFAIEVPHGAAVLPVADVCDQPHAEANARVIAAAPDMLEALQALHKNGHLVVFTSDTKEDAEIKARAIAAIAKATGSEA